MSILSMSVLFFLCLVKLSTESFYNSFIINELQTKKGVVFAVIPLPHEGGYGKHNRGQTIGHENFFSSFAPFFLTFYPFHTIYLLVMKTAKNYNSKK